MKKEDKELLLKDLCARLPYRVKCYIPELNDYRVLGSIQYDGINTLFDFWNKEQTRYEFQLYISEFKPYLYPLSSMTEEQSKIYHELIGGMFGTNALVNIEEFVEWCNKNHLDWRGLIPKGLANNATELNIY